MGFRLGPKARSAGYRLESFPEVGSTNAEALKCAEAGDEGPAWFVSKRQTAGRGRRGRAWATPEGNLAASLLLTVDTAADVAASLGFAASLALTDALDRIGGGRRIAIALDGGDHAGGRFALKWPNDVLYSGAKLAGILLEARANPHGTTVAIGIGVNVVSAPAEATYPATFLAEVGVQATPEELFEALAEAWVDRQAQWETARGFAHLREAWIGRASGLGSEIAVSLGERVVRGTFETVDEAGRLVILTDDGRQETISAGDVHFGAAATVRARVTKP